MQSQCLSISSPFTFSIKPISINPNPASISLPSFRSNHFNPLRFSGNEQKKKMMGQRRSGAVCFSSSPLLSPRNLYWVSAVSTGLLMVLKGTAINKSYLVPLFALQAPSSIVSWIKGEYGAWTAFLALLVRLFFSVPGELELPFWTLIMVIVAPLQAMSLRGTQGGTIISLAIAAYLAFRHFTRAGSLQNAFNQDSLVATLAIICITAVPCLLLI